MSFYMYSTSPCEIQGTIRVAKPIRSLGRVRDLDGQIWDVEGIQQISGRMTVAAVKVEDLHPYYDDTSGCIYGYVSQTWKPYRVEVTK